MQLLAPEASNGLGPAVQPMKAPTDPLYRTPIGSIVSPSKVRDPSTYSSAAGSASSWASASSGRSISNVCNCSWSNRNSSSPDRYRGSSATVVAAASSDSSDPSVTGAVVVGESSFASGGVEAVATLLSMVPVLSGPAVPPSPPLHATSSAAPSTAATPVRVVQLDLVVDAVTVRLIRPPAPAMVRAI